MKIGTYLFPVQRTVDLNGIITFLRAIKQQTLQITGVKSTTSRRYKSRELAQASFL